MNEDKDNYSHTLSQGSQPDNPDNLDKAEPSQRGFGPGIRLKDRYLLEKEIGQGGVGVVYLARDEELHSKRVVVKVLLQEFIQDAWFKKKFQQEIEALARIDHPGVVGVLDAGKTPGGNQFLVMQFVEGQTLTSLIKPEGMDLEKVAKIIQQMGKALTAAHNEGIIHCDLKPENVMVQNADEDDLLIKIIDFGVAKVRNSQVAKSRDVTRVAGTIHYLAPEQIEGRPSASSDIYSMGVIAYMLVTGRRPFNPRNGPLHITGHDLIEMQRSGVRFDPKELRPDLPESAQQAILKALSFDPNDRYSRARDFGDALAQALTAEENEEAVESRGSDAELDHRPTLEVGHVLIIEIVGHSNMLIEQQAYATKQLQEFARTAPQFHRTRVDKRMVSLPTANGMGLVFFGDPTAPVKCAKEVTQSFKGKPEIAVRMGLHTGPVYCVRDTNGNLNVTGGGIDIAQRVMDCGDAGHILASNAIGDVLKQLDGYDELVHYLGVSEVRHGERIQLYNLHNDEIGNPELPGKLRKDSPPHRKRAITVAIILATIAIAAVLVWIVGKRGAPTQSAVSTSPNDQASVEQATKVDARPMGRELALSFSLEAQKPSGPVVPLFDRIDSKGEIKFKFDKDDGLRMKIGTTQSGHLYILNDAAGAGMTILFPTRGSNGGSASLPANQELPVPPRGWLQSHQTGYEKFWVVWSAHPIGALEEVIQSGQAAGPFIVINEPRQKDKAREFLTQHSETKPDIGLDAEKKQMNIKAKSDVLAVSLWKR